MVSDIYHRDFQPKPYWWDAYRPQALVLEDVPAAADVAIIGGGYAGLSAALELGKQGRTSVVLDAEYPGFGASTRNGGMVSGGRSVGRRYTREMPAEAHHINALRTDAADGYDLIKRIIHDNNIDCGWHETGVFSGAWCRKHYAAMRAKVKALSAATSDGAYMVPPSRQREEIGSDYYLGGMVVERGAHIHPALYFKGLLDLCTTDRGITICAKAPVIYMEQSPDGWKLRTPRGSVTARDVVVATNGYTGNVTPQFKKRLIPIGSYMIATEELPDDIAVTISPKNRAVADSRRILSYFRMSPDGKRLLYGGRAKLGFASPQETAPILYRFMLERFPQLRGTEITHAWTGNVAFTMDEVPHMGRMDGLHYALGCNGSGIAMMTYLGYQIARKIVGVDDYKCAFDTSAAMPTHPLYTGTPWFIPWVGSYFQIRDWMDRYME